MSQINLKMISGGEVKENKPMRHFRLIPTKCQLYTQEISLTLEKLKKVYIKVL